MRNTWYAYLKLRSSGGTVTLLEGKPSQRERQLAEAQKEPSANDEVSGGVKLEQERLSYLESLESVARRPPEVDLLRRPSPKEPKPLLVGDTHEQVHFVEFPPRTGSSLRATFLSREQGSCGHRPTAPNVVLVAVGPLGLEEIAHEHPVIFVARHHRLDVCGPGRGAMPRPCSRFAGYLGSNGDDGGAGAPWTSQSVDSSHARYDDIPVDGQGLWRGACCSTNYPPPEHRSHACTLDSERRGVASGYKRPERASGLAFVQAKGSRSLPTVHHVPQVQAGLLLLLRPKRPRHQQRRAQA